MKQVLFEVENLYQQIENHKARNDWSEESKESFSKIRRKLLNNINGIARLPGTLCHNGIPCNSIPASEMMARILDKN